MRDNFRADGLYFEDITHVFCTHLHSDHWGWNKGLRDGRWVPTFPNAKYICHKDEYAYWEAATARSTVFQPQWSMCRCVQKTWVMSSKDSPAARKLSSQGALGKSIGAG